MAIFDNSPQGSPAWFEARKQVDPTKGGLTASQVPSLLGVGYDSVQELYRSNVLGVKKASTPFLEKLFKYGHDTEPVAADAIESLGIFRWGTEIKECGFITNPKYPNLGATPDRLAYTEEGLVCIEIKCPQKFSTELLAGGTKFWRYIIQLQVQIMVSEAIGGVLFIYLPDGENLVYWWPRCNRLENIILTYHQLYIECCLAKTEPPVQSPKKKELANNYFNDWFAKWGKKLDLSE